MSDSPDRLDLFLSQLKRRRVFRVQLAPLEPARLPTLPGEALADRLSGKR